MSNLVFPSLPGLKWDQAKTPIFSTRIQKSTSGRSLRAAFYQYPLYQYDLSYEILRDDTAHNELKNLMGFYLSRQGSFDSFLYIDPSDNIITGQTIGTGDSVTAAFQLIRTYGGFAEPCLDIQQPGAFSNVGSNLIVSWSNGSPGYNTFTSSGANITSAIWSSSGTRTASTASITITPGKIYQLIANETHNSGAHLALSGTGGVPSAVLAGGTNTFYFKATGSATVLTVTNSLSS